MNLNVWLSKKERDQLEMLTEAAIPAMTDRCTALYRVHGLLTAIACGPMVMPSERLPVVFHDPADVDGNRSSKLSGR